MTKNPVARWIELREQFQSPATDFRGVLRKNRFDGSRQPTFADIDVAAEMVSVARDLLPQIRHAGHGVDVVHEWIESVESGRFLTTAGREPALEVLRRVDIIVRDLESSDLPSPVDVVQNADGDIHDLRTNPAPRWDDLTPKQQAVVSWLLSQLRGEAFSRSQILDSADGIHNKGDDRVVLDQLIELGVAKKTDGKRPQIRLVIVPARIPSTLPRHASWSD